MTTITLEISDEETQIIATFIKEKGGSIISIDRDDDGFTAEELNSLKQSLKEAIMIKNGQLKPLSMSDLWND